MDAPGREDTLMKVVQWHRMWLAILRSVLFAVLIPELMMASSSMSLSPEKPSDPPGTPTILETSMAHQEAQPPLLQLIYAVLSLLCNPDLWCFVLITYLLWFPMRSPMHTWESLRETAEDTFRAPVRARVMSPNLETLSTLCWISVVWRVLSTVTATMTGSKDLTGAVLHPSFWLRTQDDNVALRIPGTSVPPFIIIDVVVPVVLAAIAYRARSLLQLKVGRNE